MRIQAFTGLLLLLLLLPGCSAGKEVSGDPKPPVRPIPHLESIPLGMPAEQVRELYGDPNLIKDSGKTWIFYEPGLDIGLYDGNVWQMVQTKGSISNGIAIGDPEEKVKETGAKFYDEGSTHRWTLLQGNEELWMVTEKGVVIYFYRRRYAAP